MNDVQEQSSTEVEFDELATLKARADMLGINYHPKTGIDKLKAKIENKLNGVSDTEEVVTPKHVVKPVTALTHKEFMEEKVRNTKAMAGTLVRTRITCMNPAKKDWDGEIISVGSAKLGTYKKFVKFNTEDGWHIPHIIYEFLKERKCSVFYTYTDSRGTKIRKSKLVNEFSIEVLPPLTKDELKQLAIKQAMEAGKEA